MLPNENPNNTKGPQKWSDLIDVRDIVHHPAHYTVLTTNLVMLIGLLFLGWSPHMIVAAYFMETIIIGFFNVIKLAMIAQLNDHPNDPTDKGVTGWGVIPFFVLHFGFFIFIQLVVYLGFANGIDPVLKGVGNGFFPDLTLYFTRTLGDSFWFIVSNFVLGQTLYLITVFLYRKQYLTTTLGSQMMSPYARIVVQQFTIILSGFFLIAFHSSIVVPLLLITFKTFADVVVIQWELKNGKKKSGNDAYDPTNIGI